jgi:hypothetical protein
VHAKKTRHFWVAKLNSPCTGYCLSCDRELVIRMHRPTYDDNVVMVGAETSHLIYEIKGLRSQEH